MSLVQHVSAVEGPDRVDLASLYDPPENASIQLGRRLSRTISYDFLVPADIVAAEKPEPVGAHKVSTFVRTAQVVAGTLMCALASGIVFGFAALKQVLVDQEIYHDLCTAEEQARGDQLCYLQDQKLNMIFIVGSVTTNLSALLVGSMLDRWGPYPCGLISCALIFLGSTCMAFANVLPLDGYVVGYFLLSLGGTFIFVPSFHLSNAFPQFQGLILSLITGAFDASAAVFLVFRLMYDNSNKSFGIHEFFLAYLVVPVLMLVANLLLMPRSSYETRAELESERERQQDNTLDVHDSDDELDTTAEILRVRTRRAAERAKDTAQINDLIGTEAQQVQHEIKEDEKKIASGIWGVLHGLPAHKQMATPWFVLIAMFTVIQMTRFNFFISTIWTQYEYLLDSAELATEVTRFFDLVLPIGGVAMVPFIGALLDNTSTVTVLGLLVLLSTCIGALGAAPNRTAAYWNIVLFCVYRPLYYSAMSDYAAKVFGFATFGKVYGTLICVSGLTVFSQPALQALVHDAFYEDPGPVNLYLAGASLIVGLALVMYVDAKAKAIRQYQYQVLIANAGQVDPDDERRSLLSVSIYDNMSGRLGSQRRRVDLRSPHLRPQDLASHNSLGASLFYSYGSIGAPALSDAGGDDESTPTATPYGSLRPRRSRQALGAGLRTVTEREEPPDEADRKIREWQERTSQRQSETDESSTTASDHAADDDEGDGGHLNQVLSLDERSPVNQR
jgi:MFS family permease